jgi:hypothetical protein
MKPIARWAIYALLAVGWLLAVPAFAWAQFSVTLDTAGLSSAYSYAIEYQFALGGAGTGNTAAVSGITFGTGGSAESAGSVQTIGSVTGDLQSQPIVLSGISGGYADFTQDFTPGSQLQFTVKMSNLSQTGGNSDTFIFDLLYLDPSSGNWYQISTNNPNFNNALLEIDTSPFGVGQPSYIASDSNDPNFTLPAPDTMLTAPAPSTFCLLLTGLPALILFRRWPSLLRCKAPRTAVA